MIVGTINDLLITSLETITGYEVNGGELAFVLDELQNASISNTEDVTGLTGKQGRTLGQLKTNKATSLTATNGTLVTGLMAAQLGTTVTNSNTLSVKKIEYLKVSSNKAVTSQTATGTAGDEIGVVYVRGNDGIVTSKLTQDSAVAAGKFTYTPGTKTITFNSGDIADNTQIMVTYNYTVTGDNIKNDSEKHSDTYEMFIDAFAEDKCKEIYHVQIHAPFASLTGNFDLALGDSQTVHNLEAAFLAPGCGTNDMWELTVFEEE